MEPEDLPWPGELEEEEEEGEKEEEEEEKAVGDIVAVEEDYVVEEDHAQAEDEAVVADVAAEVEPAEVAEQEDSVKSDETVLVEEVEEEARPELDVDFDFEFQSQSRESIDDEVDDEEEDEEAKAWLQAPPEASFSPPPPPRHSYLTGERTSGEKIVPLTCNIWQQPLYQGNVRTQISDTSFVSLETTSQWSSEDDQRMESWHGLLQEKKSSPQSLDTSQTRINLKAERSKVTESSFLEEGVLTQSEGQVKKLSSPLLVIQDDFATPDLPLLTCLTQDQEFGPDSLFHQSELDFAPLRGIPDKSEDIEWFSRPSEVSEALLQATSEASSDLVNSCFSVSQYPLISSTNIGSQHSCLSPEQKSEEYVVNDQKTPKDFDSYDVLCSYMSWKPGKDTKQSENNLADKDQVSVSTLSAISDDNIATKSNDSFDASSEHVQCWKEEALQQAETCLNSTDNICFPQEVATPPHNKRSYSFLRCLLERRGKKGAPLDPENHYFENVDLRVPAENEVKQKVDFLEGYEGNEEDLQKELSRYFEQNESRSNLVSSEVHPTSPEMNYAENVVVVDNSVRVSEAHILSRGHDISKTEASSGSLQTVEVQLDETSEPLYFEEERNQKATSIFEDLHGKAKSDVITLDGDSKCRSLDEHAVVCCEKVDELQGNTCDQYNLATSEYVELATLENLIDDLCESSLNWQPTLQSSSKENKPVSHSNLCINQSFSSTLPSFAPYEPTRDSEHHSSNLRMLRVSPDTVTKIVGDTTEGGKAEITESKLESVITTTPGDSDLGSHLSMSFEELSRLAASSSQECTIGQHIDTLSQKAVTDSHLTEENLKVSDIYEPVDQNTEITTVPTTAYLDKQRGGNLYQEGLPEDYLIGQPLTSDDQKSGIPTVSSVPYSPRDQPGIFYQPVEPKVHLPEETLKTSAPLGPADQKTGISLSTKNSYSQRKYQESLPVSHPTDWPLTTSAATKSPDHMTGIPGVTFASCSQREKPGLLYQQPLPGSNLPGETLKVSATFIPAVQRTGIPTVTPTSYSQSDKPDTFYQRSLLGSHLPEQTVEGSLPLTPADQTTGIPTVSAVYLQRDWSDIFFEQSRLGSHLPEDTQKASVTRRPADQKSGIPIVTSVPYSYREEPDKSFQQVLPESHLNEESLKTSGIIGSDDKKTRIPIVSSALYSNGEKSHVFYHQALSKSHPTEELRKVSVSPRPGDQKIGMPSELSSSYSHREKPSIFFQHTLPGNHLLQEALKVASDSGSADQNSGIRAVPSRPSVIYQQELPDSHQVEKSLKVVVVPGPDGQKSGISIVSSTPYSQREKPVIFYQHTLPDRIVEANKILSVSGSANQIPGVSITPSTSYLYKEKSGIFYEKRLSQSHLTEATLNISGVSGTRDQKTETPIPSASYLQREKPGIFYQQAVPGSPIPRESLKVSVVPGPADQNTGTPILGKESIIFYQHALPGSPVTNGALKVSAISRQAKQKIGTPVGPSDSYLLGEKSIFYQEGLQESHLHKDPLKVLVFPEEVDQKPGIPPVTSSSYSSQQKTIVSYQQELPGSNQTEKNMNVSVVPGPTDQKSRISTVPSGISLQYLPDHSEEVLKVLGVFRPAEQNTGIQVVTSTPYSHREKPIISYQQELPDITTEALKVIGVPRLADDMSGIYIVPSSGYSQKEEPVISYQPEVPSLTEGTLKTGVSGPKELKTGIQLMTASPYSHTEKPSGFSQQELPKISKEAADALVFPEASDPNIGVPTVPVSYYSHIEKPIVLSQPGLPASHLTEEAPKVSAVSVSAEQKKPTGPSSFSQRENPSDFYQQTLPDGDLTEGSLKSSTAPGPTEQNRSPTVPSSYSHKEKLKISTANLLDDQKTELPTATHSSYLQREKPKVSTVIGSDDQKTPLAVFRSFYSQKVKPGIFFQQQLPHKEQSKNISTVPEPTDVKTGIPIPLPSSHLHQEKASVISLQELSDRHLPEDVLKVSTAPEPVDQKTVLPTASSSSFSHKEKGNSFYQKDLPDRHQTENSLKGSSGLGKAEQITGLPTVSSGTYSHDKKQELVSEHVQRLADNLNSDSNVSSNNMLLNSETDDGVIVSKPESQSFGDVVSEEIRDSDNGSKTLKEIRTLLMEAENIALKRCNFSAPLVPFRDVNDIPFVQSKKMVCFKEPSKTDVTNNELLQRQTFTEESPSIRCIQKDIGTQTNLKFQRGIGNWEFISSTTLRSPLQEAESKPRVTLDGPFRQYEAARSMMRSEPEGYNGTIGNKIIIPMMTIIKNDSSSDVSDGNGSCSWDSNLPESLESVSDVVLNFLPCVSPKTSITDSREEECVSDSEDGYDSVDSLAAHVKNLLQCESSLNHARQILKNAEEEESRVRAQAWKLKLNLAHDYGYPISELNEDDRRKVEEIKAKLFCEGRTTDFSESPRGIGCPPESVCSHIIIESHEKGCFRTVSTQPPQVNSHPCVSRSVEPSEVIRGRRSPAPWRNRHINFSKSLDQNNPHLKVWNSLQLQSHPPFQNLMHDDFKISKSFGMPFRENIDPWLSEIEPAFVPPKEVDFHSSPQILPSEPMKQFTTSITFSSHRHSKCISDSSVFKVGVTQGSQYTGTPVGVFNSHVIEEQISPRDLKQKASSPSSIKKLSYLPDREMTILAEGSRQSQTLPVDSEHSHQEEKLLERSGFKVSHSEPRNGTNSKEVQLSDNNTLISMDRPSSSLGVKEKNVIITPDLPSHIFLEQRELFEQSKSPHTDHSVRKHHSPPCLNLPPCIFLEQKELYEQSKVPHVDHEMRESHTPLPQCQDSVASDLHSPICFEHHQSKAPGVDAHHFLFSQGQDCVVEKTQHRPNSPISNLINVEAKFNNVISQSAPDYCQLETSASTPPSNRKALSCIRITLCPKTPSKLDSGTLDKRFHLLDPASKTRMNSEFNRDLQYKSSESLEPTSKLLTSKPLAQDQEYVGFLGPKTPPDLQAVQSPFPDSKTIIQDLKNLPSQNSQIVTSRQTQVNISDLEGYSKPEETPVSADGSREQSKPHFSASSGKLSSDAVTQITTESPEKTMFSSEIFINAGNCEERSTSKPPTVPVKFASSSSVQQISPSHGADGQPVLLPYKPAGSQKMYYVPQLEAIPSFPDCKSSDTTLESSHSGSNDAIAPDFPAQVLGTRDDNPRDTVNIKHEEGIYSKRAVTKASFLVGKKPFQKDDAEAPIQVPEILSGKHKEEIFSQRVVTKIAWPEGNEYLQKDTEDSNETITAEDSAQIQDKKIENLPETKAFKQKEEIHIKRTVCKEARPKEKESLQIDISESKCHSEFENTTHSVFRSAKFYFHHPVHLPNDQDFCHESLGKSTLMRQSWKDFFQHHSNKLREPTCLPLSYQSVDKTKMDYSRGKSLSINMNLGDNEEAHASKSQARDNLKNKRQINDPKKDHKVTTELTTQPTTSLNELWNKYQERQKQQKPQKPLDVSDKKELSLIERLDRLAKLLQNPITHSLQVSESTLDDSRGERDFKEWNNKQQKKKLQKQKRYRSLEKGHKNIGDLRKSKVASHQTGKSSQIKIEQIKFDKYILKKQPYLNYISNTSSDSRPSEESELFTDTTTNILSTTTSPLDSDILTQTDREVTLHERSSSISTIDTARLIQAFGHERVCLSPRQIKLYSSITNQQRRYLEKRCKHTKKALNISHPQMTSEHTRRKHIQMANHRISSDSVASASSCLSLESTLCTEQIVPMFNKGIQAGNLEILDGVKKHTRDVGMTFPTPCSSEARLEEESDETSVSEEIIKEKTLFASPLEDKKLKSKQNSYEGVSWFVPVENVKPATKKENCPKSYGPGISWFEPMSRTKPWREPLREQNWQKQCMVGWGLQPGPGGDVGQEQLTPFVRTTLQESLQLHRPDFISRSGERVKRLKLIVQERKLQNVFQSERNALFNAMHPLPKRVLRMVQKNKPIGRKEMIQRSKRIYEQLPEVQKKREEEKRKSEYKSNRLRAQLFRKKLTSQLLGRKVPWD
ncbi:centrosome-associated protein ALMS1 isoform X1 [Dipodomys merriami]|uniref:centrosome-associated protein ALMS1 isoform X1 n=2 Tax=Dipodomys merriami TaxID=94247 RepID=UPI003855E5C8